MNDLERLQLLDETLEKSEIGTTEKIGRLANDIESIRSLLGDVSEEFSASFAKLWAALEVVGVRHQEEGTEPTQQEAADLDEMKKNLKKHTEREIADKAG